MICTIYSSKQGERRMPPTAPAATVLHTRVLTLPTHEPIQLVDITAPDRGRRPSGSPAQTGWCRSFRDTPPPRSAFRKTSRSCSRTCASFLSRLAPPDAAYGHNDFRVRTQHMHPDERPNGHAHCLQLLLGSSESVPVIDGQLQLGEWQRLFLVELDGPRPQRELLVQVMGQAAKPSASRLAAAGRHAGRDPDVTVDRSAPSCSRPRLPVSARP